jgi:hypothetical protein
LPLGGAKDGHFSFYQRSRKIGLSSFPAMTFLATVTIQSLFVKNFLKKSYFQLLSLTSCMSNQIYLNEVDCLKTVDNAIKIVPSN